MRPEESDWHKVQELTRQLQREGRSVLKADERDLLRRVAQAVAIPEADAETALQASPGAMDLAMEVSRRIREGSRRLMRAISEANRRKEAGDTAGARKLIEDLLAVEVVPLYRRQAEAELRYLE